MACRSFSARSPFFTLPRPGTAGAGEVLECSFLGRPAKFPVTPFYVAARAGVMAMPVFMLEEEIAQIEDALDETWPLLSASAQSVIDRQGVATIDTDGDLVTSIVGGKDCVFTCQGQCKAVGEHTVKSSVTLCAIEKTCGFKPISCALYPIREKRLSNGLTGINVHRQGCEPLFLFRLQQCQEHL